MKGELLPSEKEDLKNNLNSTGIIEQQPNYKTLKIARLGLWLYNRYDSSRKSSKVLGWLINDNWLKPPVIYDSLQAKRTTINMEDYLINQGYFHASAGYNANIKKQKANVTYDVNTGANFLIDSINYDIADSAILQIVKGDTANSLLQHKAAYKTDLLSDERDRITNLLRDSGYFKFTSDEILFIVDTTDKSLFRASLNPFESVLNVFNAAKKREKPTLDITVVITNPEDSDAYKRYRIRQVNVYPDFPLNGSPADTNLKITRRKYFTIYSEKNMFNPLVLARAIFFKPGDWYSEQRYNITINKLNSLGEWKFVTVQYKEVPGDSGMLDCNIFLVPNKRQEVGVSLEGTTGSDYEFGSSVGLSYQNRNVHKSANLLTMSLKSGIELDSTLSISAKEFSGQVNLNFPRFIIPGFIKNISRFSNAKTNLGGGFDYMNRVNYYTFKNYYASFGYTWNETKTKSWIVKPFVLAYNKYSNFSPAFQSELDSNEFLRNSFQSVFLEGENVSFIFNNQLSSSQKKFNYLRIDFDESGLLLKGLDGALKSASGQKTDFQQLTSLNFSQYVKVDAEYKHYYNWVHTTLVSRIYGGIAIPYGGSPVVPYIKQFFAGGPNSMRAWRLRTLGPGSYKYTSSSTNVFVDETGEMKLEGNLEYRFDIVRMFGGATYLKGALFTDAGNIWDINNDPTKPGAVFTLNHFYQDIAVGSGFGLRLDFTYFLIRLDSAVPLKDPSVETRYGWFPNGFRPFNVNWLSKNLVFNFAVGYPF
jgi:outer membrane protein assembly factor BamA